MPSGEHRRDHEEGGGGGCAGRNAHVQKYYLRDKGAYHEDKHDVEEPLVELRFPASLRDDGGADALGSSDAQAASPAAYRDVDKHVLLSVARTDPECDKDRAHNDDARVAQEARGDDKFLHLLYVRDR